jgi:hypothetical protein
MVSAVPSWHGGQQPCAEWRDDGRLSLHWLIVHGVAMEREAYVGCRALRFLRSVL